MRDAELIRQELGVERWSVLGQSFGGFTSMTYLSIAPEGLREAFITGGLSPIGRPVDDIYGATYRRLLEQEPALLRALPGRPGARRATSSAGSTTRTSACPSGDRLTARRFRQLGLWLGDSAGFELLHHVLELPFGSPAFLHDAEAGRPVRAQPDLRDAPRVVVRRRRGDALVGGAAAARRDRRRRATSPPSTSSRGCGRTTRRCGRSARPPSSSPSTPGRALYDADRLRRNEVPVAATIYVNDLYVERDFAEETAATIRGLRTWMTDEFEHNGLRADGERVLGRLIDLVRGRA